MVLTEAHPTRPGFISHYYATIDVMIPSGHRDWSWVQVDVNGTVFGTAKNGFPTEEDAFDDAFATLKGVDWL
ncbi:MAG: hypothetical protein DI537_10635 [Stutzerimonas stutzeri]|nr:MAG: hypothetical protein DI537_10635 [Stutzerimonas stutzeri]